MDAFAKVLVTRKSAFAFAAIAIGVLMLIPSSASAAAFPGDNGKIAFISDRSGTTVDGDFEVWTMNADGSGAVPVTDNTAEEFTPAWSPDGTKIAFASTRGASTDIWVMDANGSSPTQLTDATGDDTSPSWSPDGTQIAFTSTRDGGVDNIYKMNADGSNETQLTNDPQSDAGPEWSPDGSKILFRSFRRGCGGSGCYWEMFLMDPDGSNETVFNDNDDPYEVEMSWAPDGSKIAFQLNPPGIPDIEIYTVDSDGSLASETNITNDSGQDGYPSWSPDGAKIAFASDRSGDWEIYTMTPTGGSVTPLASDPAATDLDPNWQRNTYYARPAGASPFRASLVPAQQPCIYANNNHGAPAAYSSCSSPRAVSPYLTVGSPPANGQAAQANGSLRVEVINPSTASEDDQLIVSLTDVRCSGASTGCAGAMHDYTGSVQANVVFRITDTYNGAELNDPATMVDLPFAWSVSCTGTGSPGLPNAIGSTCSSTTTANSLIPGFVKFGKRQMIELGQARVFDGGADGDGATGGDNALFQIQGVFNP